MTFEHAKCPLCLDPLAERSRLPDRGYQYQCPACGGPFEVSALAQRRAGKVGIHRGARAKMQQHLLDGKRPRVVFVNTTPNSYYEVREVNASEQTIID